MGSLATLLMTRPQAQSEEFARLCRSALDRDLPVVISPLQRIEYETEPPDSEGETLIFTSVHGVWAYTAHLKAAGRVAYCVGGKTMQAAREMGFKAISAFGTSEELINRILRDAPSGPLLHAAGLHTRGDIVETLQKNGLNASRSIVYSQIEHRLSDLARRTISADVPVVVPLFSPRSAAIFQGQVPKAPKARIVCISAAAMDEIRSDAFCAVVAVAQPDATFMLNVVVRELIRASSS
ncbi:MAG: uroporphyrinogen-III synthase [Pseudomonadota bacterium]